MSAKSIFLLFRGGWPLRFVMAASMLAICPQRAGADLTPGETAAVQEILSDATAIQDLATDILNNPNLEPELAPHAELITTRAQHIQFLAAQILAEG